MITALQGRATDVLQGVPIGATFEKTVEDLKDHFEDRHPSRPEAHERIPLAHWLQNQMWNNHRSETLP